MQTEAHSTLEVIKEEIDQNEIDYKENEPNSIATYSSPFREEEESHSDVLSVADYEELSSFNKYNIGESGTDSCILLLEKQSKALQRRVVCKLERKAVLA